MDYIENSDDSLIDKDYVPVSDTSSITSSPDDTKNENHKVKKRKKSISTNTSCKRICDKTSNEKIVTVATINKSNNNIDKNNEYKENSENNYVQKKNETKKHSNNDNRNINILKEKSQENEDDIIYTFSDYVKEMEKTEKPLKSKIAKVVHRETFSNEINDVDQEILRSEILDTEKEKTFNFVLEKEGALQNDNKTIDNVHKRVTTDGGVSSAENDGDLGETNRETIEKINEVAVETDQEKILHKTNEANVMLNEGTAEAENCGPPSVQNLVNERELDTENAEGIVEPTVQQQQLTKKGTIRKRKAYTLKLKDRLEMKLQEKIKQYAVKKPCSDKCKKKCKSFTEERRQEINKGYWNLERQSRITFLTNNTTRLPTKHKTTEDSQRNITVKYHLKLSPENQEPIEVCKHFFLTTLGYHHKNDYAVLKAISNPDLAMEDKRGKHQKNSLTDRQIIYDHIKSFDPVVSHYRREHAPNKKYLPSDLTVNSMFNHFKEKYPNVKYSYELYRNCVKKELNISLTKLGHEECEACEYFNKHDPNHIQSPEEDCTICISYRSHKIRVTETRQQYQNDAAKEQNLENIYYSADLQKVIMLPRLDSFKSVIFCPRLIVFNESFVPVGNQANLKPLAVIWHEAVSGRRAEDITSTFHQFFRYKRDVSNIIIWTDNCASQNKCWMLFCFLIYIINSDEISAKSITLKYFEPGHSFMSADSFHHQVELSMKRKPKIYDFDDFENVVKSSNSGKVDVKVMTVSDFANFEDHSSAQRLKKLCPRIYLRDLVEVQVKRNSYSLYIKKSFQEENFTEVQFLKAKYEKSGVPCPVLKSCPRGISTQRKNAIIGKLGPLMPSSRLIFWKELPTNDMALDLCTEIEDGCDN